MSEKALPECFGKQYCDCGIEHCEWESGCKLAYQEDVAIPRMEKEMTQEELGDK